MSRRSGILRTILLLILAMVTILPFYLMISMGTHSSAELFQGISILPGKHLLKNISTVWESSFGRFYVNSLTASCAATVFGTLTSTMAGYALSKYQFRWKNLIFTLIVGTRSEERRVGKECL